MLYLFYRMDYNISLVAIIFTLLSGHSESSHLAFQADVLIISTPAIQKQCRQIFESYLYIHLFREQSGH